MRDREYSVYLVACAFAFDIYFNLIVHTKRNKSTYMYLGLIYDKII